MDLQELLESVFKEAYKIGKQDGLHGVHINPKVIYEQFIAEQNAQVEMNELFANIQNTQLMLSENEMY